jgi:hypothetical protein
VEAYRVVRLLPRNITVLLLIIISVRGSVSPWGIMRLEGLGKLKNEMKSRIEPADFQYLALYLN